MLQEVAAQLGQALPSSVTEALDWADNQFKLSDNITDRPANAGRIIIFITFLSQSFYIFFFINCTLNRQDRLLL
jgi:hypothetical protein